jgi:riboflavin kinase/FMN adenylyltransferase
MNAISVGNFDGVHLGHQALLGAARTAAGPSGTVTAVTFEPHPAAILRGSAPDRLASVEDRAMHLRAAGATRVETLVPDQRLLALSPEDFIAELARTVPFDAIVEGSDFRFGRARSGDVHTLREIGARSGFRTVLVEEVSVPLCDGHMVPARSSTARWLLSLGRVADVARVLGRPHRVSGNVVRGAARGRGIGYPTANVASEGIALPRDGVYACEVTLPDGARWAAAASVGTNPTFGACPRTLEVHVLGLERSADLYGQRLCVDFLRWIRPMLAFETVDALVAQMGRDCTVAAQVCRGGAVAACEVAMP